MLVMMDRKSSDVDHDKPARPLAVRAVLGPDGGARQPHMHDLRRHSYTGHGAGRPEDVDIMSDLKIVW
jgi:hypothetical protein